MTEFRKNTKRLGNISFYYVTQLQKMDANPSEWRCPEGFEKGTQGMNLTENSYSVDTHT